LLLLAAGQVAAAALRMSYSTGNISYTEAGISRPALPPKRASPMRRFSSTVSRPKISRPCGT
jgi:hypothetical protein